MSGGPSREERDVNKHDRHLLGLLQAAKLDLRKVAEPEQSEIRDLMNRDPDWLPAVMKASAKAYTDEELAGHLGVDVGYLTHIREQLYRQPEGD
jgi:hypothetical protein